MKSKSISRHCSEDYWKLEDSDALHGDLIEIKTCSKKETTEKLKANLYSSVKDPEFQSLRGELLDMSIVIHVNKKRYKTQDADNIAKVVLDALKKGKSTDYLIEDDSQVVRLLIYKKIREESQDSETDQLSVSIRKHNPHKDMILKRSWSLMTEEEFLEREVKIKNEIQA